MPHPAVDVDVSCLNHGEAQFVGDVALPSGDRGSATCRHLSCAHAQPSGGVPSQCCLWGNFATAPPLLRAPLPARDDRCACRVRAARRHSCRHARVGLGLRYSRGPASAGRARCRVSTKWHLAAARSTSPRSNPLGERAPRFSRARRTPLPQGQLIRRDLRALAAPVRSRRPWCWPAAPPRSCRNQRLRDPNRQVAAS